MLTLKKVITDKPFDHVIVDEAAAACLPDVVHAVGHARTGAVVLGDYLQNGPIVDDDIEKVERLNALYQLDCFTNFHLTDPDKAQQNPGCVVMAEQWRFGEKLTRLTNVVAYGGRLSAVQPKACDIVLIDCDGLGSALNTIYRPNGGWAGTWPIGALVARALAEHHQPATCWASRGPPTTAGSGRRSRRRGRRGRRGRRRRTSSPGGAGCSPGHVEP